MGYRLVGYPLVALAVPVWWALRGRRRYPHAADLCLTAPFLLDTAGNTANLYDSVWWWDDAMHVATWFRGSWRSVSSWHRGSPSRGSSQVWSSGSVP
jgi:hypothetical protein